jgi:hypothetical protein
VPLTTIKPSDFPNFFFYLEKPTTDLKPMLFNSQPITLLTLALVAVTLPNVDALVIRGGGVAAAVVQPAILVKRRPERHGPGRNDVGLERRVDSSDSSSSSSSSEEGPTK